MGLKISLNFPLKHGRAILILGRHTFIPCILLNRLTPDKFFFYTISDFFLKGIIGFSLINFHYQPIPVVASSNFLLRVGVGIRYLAARRERWVLFRHLAKKKGGDKRHKSSLIPLPLCCNLCFRVLSL